ncbi:MAG: 3-deoxy-manno-octulosonate cytidylyltransferase [Armatimonadota bacterium]
MNVLVVIPARMASTRFPGKPLADLAGRPMILWVVEAARRSLVGEVLVATPDQEIADCCLAAGVPFERTRLDHLTGTDRIAEVAERRPADIYVNVQGDEPLIAPESIVACTRALVESEAAEMATLWSPADDHAAADPSIVKVVATRDERALYFSRAAIPFARDSAHAVYRRHIGLYAYRRATLARIASLRPTPLELAEGLEQLRFLENGIRIQLAQGGEPGLAVDLPEHAEAVRGYLVGHPQANSDRRTL